MSKFKIIVLSVFSVVQIGRTEAQSAADSLSLDTLTDAEISKADDPAQYITRMEIYNELQYYEEKDIYINQAVLRGVVRIGKRFSTRIDLPYVGNTTVTANDYRKTGIGDISFRLLGFKFFEKKYSAFTASLEVSLNTAKSPTLGTGKTVLLPMVSYTHALPKKRMLYSVVFQQANSVYGSDIRKDISFSRLQLIVLKAWSKKSWTVVAPEFYYDYTKDHLSMNMRARMTFAPGPRLNLWVTPGAGIFGDFVGRYLWSMDVGMRFFLFREHTKAGSAG